MKRKISFILFILLLAVSCFAQKAQKSDPVLSASPGKSILGQRLPPGTYRIVPELGSDQGEASIKVTFDDGDSGGPKLSDQSKTGQVTDPVQIDDPQAIPPKQQIGGTSGGAAGSQVPSKKKPQITQQGKPSAGTGPEFDCEYGLPKRDGADCEIQLTNGDLPTGWRIDNSLNMNKACVVNQWILYGSDKENRIEVNRFLAVSSG